MGAVRQQEPLFRREREKRPFAAIMRLIAAYIRDSVRCTRCLFRANHHKNCGTDELGKAASIALIRYNTRSVAHDANDITINAKLMLNFKPFCILN